jgi:hypothetical protein
MIPRQEPGKPLDVDKAGQRMMYILTNGRSPMGMGAEVRKMYPLFDYDLSGAPVAVRPTSTTPAQDLFFLNNPLPKFLADKFADRLLRMTALDDRKRLDMAHLLALGRPPGKEVADQSLAYLKQCEAEHLTKQQAWSNLCQALFATAEFRYID